MDGDKKGMANLVFRVRFFLLQSLPRHFRRLFRRQQSRFRNAVSRFMDPRRSLLSRRQLLAIQEGTMNYRYRGIRMMKNPFDLALYMMILDDLKPRTIIEIGSAFGGSGKFFLDQTKLRRLGTKIWSLDVNPVTNKNETNLTFLAGDVHRLEDSELPTVLATAARPLLVIEDGPHTYEGSLAALNFFAPHMLAGDLIVVEDGNLRDLGRGYYGLKNGPHRAIRSFLKANGSGFTIDTSICDFFGQNVTWNIDGYLRKL